MSCRHRLESLDRLIREGKSAEARIELEALGKRKRLPREELALFANLAWRAGLPKLGTRLLNPIVRPSRRLPVDPSSREKAEYAACLARLGGGDEALELLRGVPEKDLKELPLYQAFALTTRWDYAETIPLLRRYLASRGLSSYQKLVARTNLAAALVHERQHRPAEGVLRDLLYETSLRRLHLLLGVSFELAAVNRIFARRFDSAHQILERAERTLRDVSDIDGFFVQKWRAILELVRHEGKGDSRKILNKVRRAAAERAHWETLRDCDRFEAVVTGNETLFRRVYFGTPYESFRARILKDFPRRIEIPDHYLWRDQGETEPGPALDLRPGAAHDLPEGQLLHRLLVALFSDFYRPLRPATLYARIFPGEFFNPLTSPHRVHESVRRLREWLRARRFPLEVRESDGTYRVAANAPCTVIVTLSAAQRGGLSSDLRKLKEKCPPTGFSASEASEVLSMPMRSAQRVLQMGVEEGKLTRSGKARAIRYRFAQ